MVNEADGTIIATGNALVKRSQVESNQLWIPKKKVMPGRRCCNRRSHIAPGTANDLSY